MMLTQLAALLGECPTDSGITESFSWAMALQGTLCYFAHHERAGSPQITWGQDHSEVTSENDLCKLMCTSYGSAVIKTLGQIK